MIRLVDIGEDNFFAFRALEVAEEQRGFLDSAVGILARGYAYRACRGRVFGVAEDRTAVGLALVRDLDEEPSEAGSEKQTGAAKRQTKKNTLEAKNFLFI